jgi:polar amino acid transport system substrate-binding protein
LTKRLTLCLALGSTLLIAGCGGNSSSGATSGTTSACPTDATAPSSKVAAPPSSDLQTAGTLTVGSDVSYPPQEFYPSGCSGNPADGFDLDIGKALAAHMGLKFAVVDQKFDGIIPALSAKKYDVIISSMTITDERKKDVTFVPYFSAGESFVTTSGSSKNPQTIKDLCGLKVAVEKGTTEESDAGDANDKSKNGPCASNPIQFKDLSFDKDTQALEALRKGTADVHFTDSPVASYELLKNKGFKITNKDVQATAPEGIAIRKSDTAMSTAITAAFEAMKSDGTYKKLLDKWQLAGGDITKAS